jgi:hypothetical protein
LSVVVVIYFEKPLNIFFPSSDLLRLYLAPRPVRALRHFIHSIAACRADVPAFCPGNPIRNVVQEPGGEGHLVIVKAHGHDLRSTIQRSIRGFDLHNIVKFRSSPQTNRHSSAVPNSIVSVPRRLGRVSLRYQYWNPHRHNPEKIWPVQQHILLPLPLEPAELLSP